MIRKIEALRFRCLRHISRELHPFQILVGPNASGKSSFLDTVGFLGDLVHTGLEAAITNRSPELRDLLWQKNGDAFELAVELPVPEQKNDLFDHSEYDCCRYEVSIGSLQDSGESAILAERVLLLPASEDALREEAEQQTLFPADRIAPDTLAARRGRGVKTVVHKVPGSNDKFYDETGTGWDHSFKLGPQRSALANLPEDESRFPIATWLKRMLNDGIRSIALNSRRMQQPTPPGQPARFQTDGSNLAGIASGLSERDPQKFSQWIQHLQAVLPDLRNIEVVERPEDRHRYLVIHFSPDLRVPSWMVSEGTLRLLALTLPAFLEDFEGTYLIEEPENGLHPRAVESVLTALSSTTGGQVLLTTHSPVVISSVSAGQILCFSKTDSGATDVIPSSENPALKAWRGDPNLGILFADAYMS